MEIVALVGRILFPLIFLASGFNHLIKREAMTGYAQSKKLPFAQPLVLISGTWILVGGLSVMLGIWGDLGALMLAAFTVTTAFVFHAFWQETEPAGQQMESVQFFKDLSLAGGALLIFSLYVWAGDKVDWTVTDALFKDWR